MKLWQILVLLWEPLRLAGHERSELSDSDIQLVQKIFYLFQWSTNVDLGYRFALTHERARISSPRLRDDLVGFEYPTIPSPLSEDLLGNMERQALERFALLWQELPADPVISVRQFVSMIARYHFIRHIAAWNVERVDEDFRAHHVRLSESALAKLMVQRELFLGKLYQLACEYQAGKGPVMSKK